jgi:hypothetical protein
VTTQIRVICTDSGTHPSREIELLSYSADPDPVVDIVRRAGLIRDGKVKFGRQETGNGSLVSLGDVADPRGALWRFVCPTCRRDWPLRDDTLIRVLQPLIAAGRTSVDFSALPPELLARLGANVT